MRMNVPDDGSDGSDAFDAATGTDLTPDSDMASDTTSPPVRIIIVDDHPMLVDGLRLALDAPGLTVAATAATAAEALAVIDQTAPDVVVMDIHLPDASGIKTTRIVKERHPGIAVLVLTMAEDDYTLTSAMAAGASGYLVKGAGRAEIVRAVRAVADGQIIFGAASAHTALRSLRPPPRAQGPDPFSALTARERDILAMIAAGHGNAAIARRLGITAKTAANHVSNILPKLGVTDRTQAALLAIAHDITGDRETQPRNR